MQLAICASQSERAQAALAALGEAHHWSPLAEAEAVVVLGGDGYLLEVLHAMLDAGRVIPAFGVNHGTIGFLMNKARSSRPLIERVAKARPIAVDPLEMVALTDDGREHRGYAINEVSLLRQTRQTARIEVAVNGRVRIAELACDGVLVSTPAGSTAYNLSAAGPILPLASNLLALTPISPFRPRRWRGAILPETARVSLRVIEPDKRPVAVVADQKEVRDIREVRIGIARDRELTLLFDRVHSLEERILAEQFLV